MVMIIDGKQYKFHQSGYVRLQITRLIAKPTRIEKIFFARQKIVNSSISSTIVHQKINGEFVELGKLGEVFWELI